MRYATCSVSNHRAKRTSETQNHALLMSTALQIALVRSVDKDVRNSDDCLALV